MGSIEIREGSFRFLWVHLKFVLVHLGFYGFTLNSCWFMWVSMGSLEIRVGSFGFLLVHLKFVRVH